MRVWRRVSEAGEQPAADAHDQRRDDHYVPVALCELDFRYKSTLQIQPQKAYLDDHCRENAACEVLQ